jgi:hypothetical protein
MLLGLLSECLVELGRRLFLRDAMVPGENTHQDCDVTEALNEGELLIEPLGGFSPSHERSLLPPLERQVEAENIGGFGGQRPTRKGRKHVQLSDPTI